LGIADDIKVLRRLCQPANSGPHGSPAATRYESQLAAFATNDTRDFDPTAPSPRRYQNRSYRPACGGKFKQMKAVAWTQG
jgi:hypothetical protein